MFVFHLGSLAFLLFVFLLFLMMGEFFSFELLFLFTGVHLSLNLLANTLTYERTNVHSMCIHKCAFTKWGHSQFPVIQTAAWSLKAMLFIKMSREICWNNHSDLWDLHMQIAISAWTAVSRDLVQGLRMPEVLIATDSTRGTESVLR